MGATKADDPLKKTDDKPAGGLSFLQAAAPEKKDSSIKPLSGLGGLGSLSSAATQDPVAPKAADAKKDDGKKEPASKPLSMFGDKADAGALPFGFSA